MVTLFVPDLPEFAPLVSACRKAAHCEVRPPRAGYWRIEAEGELQFHRKALGLKPALWNSALSGGFVGRIVEYGRDELRVGEAAGSSQ